MFTPVDTAARDAEPKGSKLFFEGVMGMFLGSTDATFAVLESRKIGGDNIAMYAVGPEMSEESLLGYTYVPLDTGDSVAALWEGPPAVSMLQEAVYDEEGNLVEHEVELGLGMALAGTAQGSLLLVLLPDVTDMEPDAELLPAVVQQELPLLEGERVLQVRRAAAAFVRVLCLMCAGSAVGCGAGMVSAACVPLLCSDAAHRHPRACCAGGVDDDGAAAAGGLRVALPRRHPHVAARHHHRWPAAHPAEHRDRRARLVGPARHHVHAVGRPRVADVACRRPRGARTAQREARAGVLARAPRLVRARGRDCGQPHPAAAPRRPVAGLDAQGARGRAADAGVAVPAGGAACLRHVAQRAARAAAPRETLQRAARQRCRARRGVARGRLRRPAAAVHALCGGRRHQPLRARRRLQRLAARHRAGPAGACRPGQC